MSRRHPTETDLALLAGGDCGRIQRFFLRRHVAGCGDCRDTLAGFGELRAAIREYAAAPEPGGTGTNWETLSAEMRANIRVGLAAGECVREAPAKRWHKGWKPQLAMGMAGVLLLAGAGIFLRGLLPHDGAAGAASTAVLESTGAGIEVRTDSGSMTLLNHGDATGNQTITSQGAIRRNYVDGNTGTVTVTSVYVE